MACCTTTPVAIGSAPAPIATDLLAAVGEIRLLCELCAMSHFARERLREIADGLQGMAGRVPAEREATR